MKKITKDEVLKVVKKQVKLFYNNVLHKPFLRLDHDNSHLWAFKSCKKYTLEAPNLAAYQGLWLRRTNR